MLLVGLGNPGKRYETTRHNIGFRWLDRVAAVGGGGPWRKRYRGWLSQARLANRPVTLLKPETFMNLSGEAVQAAMTGLRVKPADVLVAHDELDLPFGALKLKVGGGTGGHNGLKSIQAHIGQVPFVRLRFGIGHPGKAADVVGYVLQGHSPAEEARLPELFDRATAAVERLLNDGTEAAMQWLHTDAASVATSE